ncbi:hypothetical protein GQ607_017096 [Colletotrichum asianum]|uniref:Uncharacterized protein n=1 Tax=Colletotrichum asianum TaxID=702518 RepID=A0A8H3VWY8_9PEZI|nr:hypothetical protein GQ607_017096 [Colletotrichum asianum]
MLILSYIKKQVILKNTPIYFLSILLLTIEHLKKLY